jgi:hypothetical protein
MIAKPLAPFSGVKGFAIMLGVPAGAVLVRRVGVVGCLGWLGFGWPGGGGGVALTCSLPSLSAREIRI